MELVKKMTSPETINTQQEINQRSPLHIAALEDKEDIVEYMLRIPSLKPLLLDINKNTVLDVAAIYGHNKIV